MGSVLNSVDNIIASAADNGPLLRFVSFTDTGTSTAANTTSGYTSGRRCATTLPVPSSLGAGLTSVVFPHVKLNKSLFAGTLIAALEYDLGTINMNSGAFTDGVAMPTKTILGVSVTTAAQIAVLVVNSAVTATTPAVTISYTDQGGSSGSAVLTLPTNVAAKSAFLINPHLGSADSGIRDVTNITKSAGSAGDCKVYGLLILGHSIGTSSAYDSPNVIPFPTAIWPCETSATIAFYAFGSTAVSATDVQGTFMGVADN